MQTRQYYVYIITNLLDTVLYIGVTNNLLRRLQEHRDKTVAGFSARYALTRLVYYEESCDIESALNREKQLKKWSRKKKEALIQEMNPERRDLSLGW